MHAITGAAGLGHYFLTTQSPATTNTGIQGPVSQLQCVVSASMQPGTGPGAASGNICAENMNKIQNVLCQGEVTSVNGTNSSLGT
eukprot:1156759-Pelagomonas_calceolata.AAC.1